MRYIIDIDGTVARDTHRALYNMSPCDCGDFVRTKDERTGRWSIFNRAGIVTSDCQKCHGTGKAEPTREDFLKYIAPENVLTDEPIESAMSALQRLATNQVVDAVFLTGRHEGIRDATTEWLWRHLPPELENWSLVMRKSGDRRVATIYKSEQLDKIVSKQFNIFIDDDPHMYSIYDRYNGIWLMAPGCWDYIAPIGATHTETWWK